MPFNQLPTVLAKILGVFRISFKSQSSGRNKRMDVLVMENIYYNKTITEQFDLKGSLRNRMVETSSGKNTVLLDENLIQSEFTFALQVYGSCLLIMSSICSFLRQTLLCSGTY